MRPLFVFSPGSNACVSRPCSLLCLPKANNSKSCRCPEGVASSVLPSGDLMCECPQGYQRENNTCLKEGGSQSSFLPAGLPHFFPPLSQRSLFRSLFPVGLGN